jgi:L-glyceraldehyde 3-phosphate reductase
MWEGPYGDGGSKKYLVASLDQSLKRMGLEYVDIFYHHRPDDSTPLEETFEALDLIVKQGKALYTGVSNYDGMHFNNALKVIEKRGLSPITIHQPYYNLLSPGPETDLFPYTANNGTGVIAFCPLAGGQLTDRYLGGLPSDSREGKRGVDGQKWWNEFRASKKYEQIDGLNNLAKKRGQTLAQMSLAWVLRLPAVTSALIGASRHEQIAQNIETLKNLDFAPEEIAAIDQLRAL